MKKNIEYHDLLTHFYQGIQWVQIIEGKNDWPNVWISVCTHWSETVWLEIIDHLKKEVNIINGKLYFILSNILAYEKNQYMKGMWWLDDKSMLIHSRYIDENMNRCCSEESLMNPINYERSRAKELISVLQELDILFDIHSTYSDTWSMLIHTQKSHDKFNDLFDADEVYIGLPETVIGKPFGDIVNRGSGIWFAIEAGSQLNQNSYKTGLNNVSRLISHLNMWNNKMSMKKEKENKKISIIGRIMIHNETFKSMKSFKHLDKIYKGEYIAYDWIQDIYAQEDCYIVLPSNHKPWEEYCFLWKIEDK